MTHPDLMVPSWDKYFMSIARIIASRSKDRSTQVGCVIVGPDNEVRSSGYNSFPRGMDDNVDARHERPEKYFWTEHAERNAVYNAARIGTALKSSRLYGTHCPCMDCARAIVSSGIVEVVVPKMLETDPMYDRWKQDFPRTELLFNETGVKLRWYTEDSYSGPM